MKVSFENGIDRRTEEHTGGFFGMKDVRMQGKDITAMQVLDSESTLHNKKPYIENGTAEVPNPAAVPNWGNLRVYTALKNNHGLLVSSNGIVLNQAPFIIHYDDDAITEDTRIPEIENVQITLTSSDQQGGTEGLGFKKQFCYLAIPKNILAEAGPWFYFNKQNHDESIYKDLDITFTFNDFTETIDLYRTKELKLDHPGVHPISSNNNNSADFTFYFLRRISKRPGSGNTVTTTDGPNTRFDWVYPTETSPVAGNEDAPGAFNPENINFLTNGVSSSNNEHTQFGANTVRNDGGRVLWGNVRLRPKRPQTMTYERNSDGHNLKLQYEYKIGPTSYYGPVTILPEAETIRVPYEGADALHIFVQDEDAQPAVYIHYAVLKTPDSKGFYIEEEHDNPSARNATFSRNKNTGPALEYGTAPRQGTFTESTWLDYEFQVFMSEPFRPREITSAPVQLSPDEKIKLISTARIQEDDTRSFEFYILTQSSIYYAQRIEADIAITPIQTTYGIATDVDDYPIYTKTDFGLAFYSTSNRLILLDARKVIELDTRVVGPQVNVSLYTDIVSLAYHSEDNQLWVSTDTGLWCYDMVLGRWIGNYDETNQQIGDALEFGTENNKVYIKVSGSQKSIPPIPVLSSIKPVYTVGNPEVFTSVLSDEDDLVNLHKLIIDYEPITNTICTVKIINISRNLDEIEEVDVTFTPIKRRSYYPTIRGRKLALRINDFIQLRDISVTLTP